MVVAVATGTAKTVPLLARTTFGLPQSVTGSAATTAVTPAASAVRSMAPRLPGFSTRWATRSRASSSTSSVDRARPTAGTTPSSPSGPSRYATFSKAVRLSRTTSAPSCRACSTRSSWRPMSWRPAWPAGLNSSGQTKSVCGRIPEASARASSS